VAAVEVEEIAREPAPPPQLLRTDIQRGKEFEILEEGEVSTEMKRLRTDLAAMISYGSFLVIILCALTNTNRWHRQQQPGRLP
jgi:phosphoketolase